MTCVLVVDDSPQLRRLVRMIVERSGTRVIEAEEAMSHGACWRTNARTSWSSTS